VENRMRAVKVSSWDELYEKPGNYMFNANNEGIVANCPNGCGDIIAIPFVKANTVWQWDGNTNEPTITPSIQRRGEKCNWHGFLTKGEWVTV